MCENMSLGWPREKRDSNVFSLEATQTGDGDTFASKISIAFCGKGRQKIRLEIQCFSSKEGVRRSCLGKRLFSKLLENTTEIPPEGRGLTNQAKISLGRK